MRLSLVTLFTLLLAPALLPLASAIQGPPRPTPIPPPPDVAAPPSDAATLPSGLASKVLTPGKGTAKPGATDMVTVHYTGWTTDGKMFDSSLVRKEPNTFPLDRVIKGWGEGVQLMTAGEKRRLQKQLGAWRIRILVCHRLKHEQPLRLQAQPLTRGDQQFDARRGLDQV